MSTIKELLHVSSDTLKHLETPLLDSEVLLSYVLKKPREFLHAHPEQAIDESSAAEFLNLTERRARHEPVAYLVKRKEFYGRNFYVDERVHIPRPATEDMVRVALDSVPRDFSGTIADIGTGSGCIATTLALELPNAHVIAMDISKDALAVAHYNAETHGLCRQSASARTANEGRGFPLSGRGTGRPKIDTRLTLYTGDLLDPITEPVDIIVSNPPYGWGDGWSQDKEVFFQPKESYESGADGLAHIRELIKNIPEKLAPGGQVFIEFDPRQSEAIQKLASAPGRQHEIIKDAAGWNRILRLY